MRKIRTTINKMHRTTPASLTHFKDFSTTSHFLTNRYGQLLSSVNFSSLWNFLWSPLTLILR